MLVMTSQSYHDRSAHVLKPLNSEDSVVVTLHEKVVPSCCNETTWEYILPCTNPC